MVTEPAAKTGRNVPAAIAVGLLLGLIVVGSLLLDDWAFIAVATVAIVLGVVEVHRSLTGHGWRLIDTPLYLGSAAILAASYQYGLRGLMISLVVSGWIVLASRLATGPAGFVRDVTAALMTLMYLPLMAGFVMLMLAANRGIDRVLVFVLLTAGNDIGGYAVGSILGKHKLAPALSPKKSWEGLAGSIVANVALGSWTFPWLLHLHVWQGALTGLVLVITGTLGDLVASAIKRDLGLKDFGHILPGHGGLTDRLDGLVFNAVPIWLLLYYFMGR